MCTLKCSMLKFTYTRISMLMFTFTSMSVATLLIDGNDIAAKNETDMEINVLEKEIMQLEKDRGELFMQINKAIDESITALRGSNDSDAVGYIEDLKKHMQELNETNDDISHSLLDNTYTNDDVQKSLSKNTFLENRRKNKGKQKKVRSSKSGKSGKHLLRSGKQPEEEEQQHPAAKEGATEMKVAARDAPAAAANGPAEAPEPQPLDETEIQVRAAEADLEGLMHKGLSKSKLKERLARREKIRAQLMEWIRMKNLENEKCPSSSNNTRRLRFADHYVPFAERGVPFADREVPQQRRRGAASLTFKIDAKVVEAPVVDRAKLQRNCSETAKLPEANTGTKINKQDRDEIKKIFTVLLEPYKKKVNKTLELYWTDMVKLVHFINNVVVKNIYTLSVEVNNLSKWVHEHIKEKRMRLSEIDMATLTNVKKKLTNLKKLILPFSLEPFSF